jgi:hypothetical protein
MPEYDFIHDPGHGWIKVPLGDLPKEFFPSEYSFYDKEYAYLEEDCDAGEFMKLVPSTTLNEVYVEYFDRNKRRF